MGCVLYRMLTGEPKSKRYGNPVPRLISIIRKGDRIKIEYIYQIKNLITGIKYYGRTNDPNRRKTTHFRELKQNKHVNPKLQNAFNKYGANNFSFEVIETIENPEEIFDREEYYLNLKEEKYNISTSARSPGNYIHYGEKNGFYGRKHTEKTKRLIGEKASKRYRGSNNPFYGRKHSEETKQFLAQNAKNRFSGIPKTEEHKEKMRMSSPKAIPVIIDNIEYRSMSEASRQLNVDRKTIAYRINSKSKKFNGYRYK